MCWLVDSSVGWLVDWLVGRSVGLANHLFWGGRTLYMQYGDIYSYSPCAMAILDVGAYMYYVRSICTMAMVHVLWPQYMYYGHGACSKAIYYDQCTCNMAMVHVLYYGGSTRAMAIAYVL